jgi:hypothetical protein
MAGIAAQAVLVLQTGAGPEGLASELGAGGFPLRGAPSLRRGRRPEVSVGQALVRLRPYAFGNNRHLIEVANDVVARKLRFDTASGEKGSVP